MLRKLSLIVLLALFNIAILSGSISEVKAFSSTISTDIPGRELSEPRFWWFILIVTAVSCAQNDKICADD